MAAYTAITAWKKPRIVYQDSSVGSIGWLFEQALAEGYAGADVAKAQVFTTGTSTDLKVREARLLLDGAIGAVDKASDENVTANRTYGSSVDTWSNTLAGSDLDSDFGFAVSYVETDGTNTQDYYMIGKDFDFGLPAGAVINGIELRLTHATYSAGGGLTGINVTAIEMRVHWSWDVAIVGAGESAGIVYTANPNPAKRRKKFTHRVYTSDRDYIGQWQDVSPPKFKTDINNIHSAMTLEFARNESSVAKAIEALTTEGDEAITTEVDEALIMDIATPTGLGAGTDLDLNHEVDIDVFYGDYVTLLTESDEVILTEDSDSISVEDGAPQGRPLFTGYLSKWLLDYGGKENITGNLLTHSQELKNIMLETSDTVVSTNTTTNTTFGIAGVGAEDYQTLGQTFQVASNSDVPRIRLKGAPWPAGTTVTLQLRTGGTIGGGTLLASATLVIPAGNDPGNEILLDFILDAIVSLTAATTYHFTVDTPDQKTGGNTIYPIAFSANSSSVYASGELFYNKKANATFVGSGGDLWFEIYKAGGSTTVTYNSMDPALMYIRVIEFARSRGARVNYDTTTIEPTGTVASFTFNTNTCDEALAKILDLCPADWHRYYDFGTNMAHLHPRPATPNKYLIKGRNVGSSYKIGRDIESLVNETFFSGGGSPALYIKRKDVAARQSWRRGLRKLSDQRVTDTTSATILSDNEINRYKDPLYSGQVTFLGDDDTPIEDIYLGLLFGHQAFGNFIDALSLQVANYSYEPDFLTLQLDTLLPKTNKRVEDIRRNLDTLEQENNPSSPS